LCLTCGHWNIVEYVANLRHSDVAIRMPVHWNIDHGARRVEAFVEEGLCAADVLGYLENIAEAGAMPYAKLFDVTTAKGTMAVDELKAIGAWVRNYAIQGRGPVGPLAIAVSSANHLEAAHFADAAGSIRSLRIFRDKTEAAAWLAHALVATRHR
jgi:hypothetical protein